MVVGGFFRINTIDFINACQPAVLGRWCGVVVRVTAHFSPHDGAVYAGARFGDNDGAVFRIDSDGGITRLAETPGVTGLVVDHANGDVFISDSRGNLIHRFEGGTGRPELWVSSINPADRDPMGMAFVPAGFANDRIPAGDLLVVDSGWSDDDEISAVSTRRRQHATLLHRDGQGVGPLVHATDVTVAGDQVYVVDSGESGPGRIFRLEPDWSLTPVATAEEIAHPVGVDADPLTGDLLILDMNRKGIVRVNPATGAVDNCITVISLDHESFAGVDISPDGMQMFVTDPIAAAVFTFTRTPLGLARCRHVNSSRKAAGTKPSSNWKLRWTRRPNRLSSSRTGGSRGRFLKSRLVIPTFLLRTIWTRCSRPSAPVREQFCRSGGPRNWTRTVGLISTTCLPAAPSHTPTATLCRGFAAPTDSS